MKKIFFVGILLSLLASCKSDSTVENTEEVQGKTVAPEKTLNFAERVVREIEAKLKTEPSERYTYKIYKAHLNADDFEDAIITVNRLDNAIKNAASSSNPGKRAELGFIGNNNCFFYYDGAKDKFSVPITVGSSAKSELEVFFENVQSEAYKDLIIEYRVKDGKYRNYYIIQGDNLQIAFQWNVFENIGKSSFKANYFDYAPGSISIAKDILVYEGKPVDYNKDVNDIYAYIPKIEKGDKLLYHFFYNPKEKAYMLINK